MKTRLVKIHFTAPVHFGTGRLSDGACACAADTLFSALFIEALNQKCSDELLDAAKTGGLRLSDAFPWIGTSYYLPKPYTCSSIAAKDNTKADSSMKKAFKKLRYVPREAYASYFDGTLDAVATLHDFRSGLGTGGLTTKVGLQRIDRDEAEPYHVGSFSFSADAGLYFLAKGSFDLDPLLQTLQYSGLGGKRSAGYGRFEYEYIKFETSSLTACPHEFHTLLSTSMPCEHELSDQLLLDSAYALSKRTGFVQSPDYSPSPLKKRDFFAFAAGSSFKNTFNGDVFDVSANGAHPVWRYAKALWMEDIFHE